VKGTQPSGDDGLGARRRPHDPDLPSTRDPPTWRCTAPPRHVRLIELPLADRRTVVVLGHEQSGIPPEALDLLDAAVEIPMIGTGGSLNVAVAGSLVLYKLAGMS
jgi:tRNA C32,U32 (ribose-2'-O)-methylase TrmJ